MSDDQLSKDLASLRIDRGARGAAATGGGGGGGGARPPRNLGWLLWLLVLGGLGAVGYFVGYPMLKDKLGTPEVKVGEVALVTPQQASVQSTSTGYVVAERVAKVAAKVAGRIAELYVEEGDTLKAGDKVARLEDVDQQSAIASARARSSAARAQTAIARAQLAEAKLAMNREQAAVTSGVAPASSAEDLAARVTSLGAAVRAAEAQASAAEADARALQVQLDSFLIITPISGVVVDKLVEVGEGVAPGFGTPGVVEVVDMDSLVVEVDVPETRIAKLVAGGPCEIILDAFAQQRFRGTVKEIGRRINRSKASVPVKIAFVDKPTGLLPEMAARVSFLSQALDAETVKQAPQLVVPLEAVVTRGGSDVVFVIEDGKVRMTPVKVGATLGGGRVLETPLPTGTTVVLAPSAKLTDGQNVKERR